MEALRPSYTARAAALALTMFAVSVMGWAPAARAQGLGPILDSLRLAPANQASAPSEQPSGEVIHACVGPDGQARIVEDPSECRNSETSTSWNMSGPEGPSGPSGPAGSSGPPGAAGPQGVAGPAGPSGSSGPSGLSGPQGIQGPAGPSGATGPAAPPYFPLYYTRFCDNCSTLGCDGNDPLISGGGYCDTNTVRPLTLWMSMPFPDNDRNLWTTRCQDPNGFTEPARHISVICLFR